MHIENPIKTTIIVATAKHPRNKLSDLFSKLINSTFYSIHHTLRIRKTRKPKNTLPHSKNNTFFL